jgi:hypothetical protein
MPFVDPSIRFWIGLVVTIAVALSQGTLSLTHAVPVDWIPYVTAWAGIFAFIGSALLTALNGAGMTTQSRLASAASIPEVKSIVTTQAIAEVTSSDKIVGPPKATGTKA